ncbi:alpha/beta hydrolase [Sporosarcina sp. Te-1]|nr:alpha/beta hydrolase [Sporosarcina sp. Te-1]
MENPKEGDGSLEAIEGTWDGAIEVPGQPLPITIAIDKKGGEISIPAQGLHDYALSKVELKGSELTMEMNLQGQKMTFQGGYTENELSGMFTQAGQQFPFTLVLRGPELGERFEVDVKGGKLSALLVEPQGDGPFPVMVIIAGSGPTDKDGNSEMTAGKNDSLKLIAQSLAEQGIASIRYDKRGIGDNRLLATKEEDVRMDDFIKDAAAFVDWAKEDSRFDKVGIIGHSEGSLVGMVAAQKAEADLFVSVAGIGRPMDVVLKEQLGEALPDELKKQAFDILERLKNGEVVKDVPQELAPVFRQSVQPYMMSMMAYNPVEQVKQLSIPVLVLNGDRDLQVTIADAEALHGAKPDSKLVIVPTMNHVLKESPENREENIATYTDPELPLAEGLMESIIPFIQEN